MIRPIRTFITRSKSDRTSPTASSSVKQNQVQPPLTSSMIMPWDVLYANHWGQPWLDRTVFQMWKWAFSFTCSPWHLDQVNPTNIWPGERPVAVFVAPLMAIIVLQKGDLLRWQTSTETSCHCAWNDKTRRDRHQTEGSTAPAPAQSCNLASE